jgi:hypothetical protein
MGNVKSQKVHVVKWMEKLLKKGRENCSHKIGREVRPRKIGRENKQIFYNGFSFLKMGV